MAVFFIFLLAFNYLFVSLHQIKTSMNMKKSNNTKERMVQAARKAVADKMAWMKTVAEGGSVKQLREAGIKIVKLD